MLKNFFRKASILVTLFVFISCGDNSPFDEDYWDDPSSDDDTQEESQPNQFYTVVLNTLSANVGNISGTVDMALDNITVTTTSDFIDIPQNIQVSERVLSNLSCNEIATSFPPPVVIDNSLETKTMNTTVVSSRTTLNEEISLANQQSTGPTDILGKSFVIKGYVRLQGTPAPQSSVIFPLACGTIQSRADTNEEDTTTTTGTIGGGTTIGGVNAGTVGGVAGGITGVIGGSVAGTIGTVAGGIAGSVGGGVTGNVAGGVAGTGF